MSSNIDYHQQFVDFSNSYDWLKSENIIETKNIINLLEKSPRLVISKTPYEKEQIKKLFNN